MIAIICHQEISVSELNYHYKIIMNFKKYIIGAGICILCISSCKKEYLDTAPTDKVDNSAIFTTTDNARSALNGIYGYMFKTTDIITTNVQNKPGVGGYMLYMDFMGDDINISSSNWYTTDGTTWLGHRTDNAQLTIYVYRTFYRIIGNANYILDNIDKAEGTTAEKNEIKAETLTLRAYAYFNLVQLYGKRYDATAKPNAQLGVPLLLNSTDSNKPRESVENVYAAIIKDLDAAIALNISAVLNKSHASVAVSKGMRARVALVMQDYPNAIKFAKEVIDANAYPLMSVADYQTGFNSAALSEYMWASMPSTEQSDTFASFFGQIAYNANTSFMRGNPKRINSALYNLISASDVRKKMWEPAPTTVNFPLPTTSFARQAYMSRKYGVKVVGGPSEGDVPLMRSAEMYLILAEAYAKTVGSEALARTTLFTLVQKRDPSALISVNTGQALIDEILVNRRVELWGEGHRWLDLKRLNLPLDRSVVPNYLSATGSGLITVPAGDIRWQWLIPRSEMEANAGIVGQQNP
jgi:hypothetical protein